MDDVGSGCYPRSRHQLVREGLFGGMGLSGFGIGFVQTSVSMRVLVGEQRLMGIVEHVPRFRLMLNSEDILLMARISYGSCIFL